MNVLQHARRSRFIRYNSTLFVGAAAVGALNYLYYPVMGRLLDTISFGEVQTLISLFLQITIFLSVLGLVTVHVVTNYQVPAERNQVVLEFERLAFLISIVLLGATIIFGTSIADFLHFSSTTPLILLMVALVVSVPLTFRSAFLRGKRLFGKSSLSNLIAAGGKLLFAASLVAIGLGSAGAIGGLILAQLVGCVLAIIWATKAGLPARVIGTLRLPNMKLLAPELRYGLLVLVGSLIVTLQYSIDIVMVKHYFDPHMAGLYAGVASVARIIFFATASVGLVLMSMVKLQAAPAENRTLLFKSMALVGIIGLPIVALCALEPRATVHVLMGGAYREMAAILPALSVALFIISLLNVIVSYYLALRRYAIAPVLIVGAGITYALMATHHSTPQMVVTSLLIGSVSMLILLILWVASMGMKELT